MYLTEVLLNKVISKYYLFSIEDYDYSLLYHRRSKHGALTTEKMKRNCSNVLQRDEIDY